MQYKNYSVLGDLDLIVRYDKNGRYSLDDTMPSRDVLKLYKSSGGEIITIGSDSHKPEHLEAAQRKMGQTVRGD